MSDAQTGNKRRSPSAPLLVRVARTSSSGFGERTVADRATGKRALPFLNRRNRNGGDHAGSRPSSDWRLADWCRSPGRALRQRIMSRRIGRCARKVDLVVIVLEAGLSLDVVPFGCRKRPSAHTWYFKRPFGGRRHRRVPYAGINVGLINDQLFFHVASMGLSIEFRRRMTSSLKRHLG